MPKNNDLDWLDEEEPSVKAQKADPYDFFDNMNNAHAQESRKDPYNFFDDMNESATGTKQSSSLKGDDKVLDSVDTEMNTGEDDDDPYDFFYDMSALVSQNSNVKKSAQSLEESFEDDDEINLQEVIGKKSDRESVPWVSKRKMSFDFLDEMEYDDEIDLSKINEKDSNRDSDRDDLTIRSQEVVENDFDNHKGKLDFNSPEYREMENVNYNLRQSVNDEYDGLLKTKKRPRAKAEETSIKRVLPVEYKKNRDRLVLTREELDRVKYPERHNVISNLGDLDFEKKETHDIDKFLYKNHFKEKKKTVVSKKEVVRDKESVTPSDDLLSKILRSPGSYIRYRFDDRLIYRKEHIPNIESYDCIISPDGETIWDRLKVKRYSSGGKFGTNYIKEVESALELSRNGDYNNEFLKGRSHKTLGLWKNLDYEKKAERNRELKKEKVIKRGDALLKSVSISNGLGLTSKALSSLIVIPEKVNEFHEATWTRYTKVDGKDIRLDIEDRDIIKFIGQFKYSVVPILKNLWGRSELATRGRLERLKSVKLVRDFNMAGVGDIWVLTELGHQLANYGMARITSSTLPSITGMPPYIAAQYVASFLYNNRVNVLNLNNFPYEGKLVGDTFERGETLISENQIKSSINNELKRLVEENNYEKAPYSGFYVDMIAQNKKQLFIDWDFLRRDYPDADSPEFLDGYEYCWSTYPDSTLTNQRFHNPDLVVRRERTEDGKPQSIAIEIERKSSTPEQFAEIFNCYKLDNTTYGLVVWITSSSSVANRIREGAFLAKFKNYKIIPFLGEEGGLNIRNPWEILTL